MDNKKPKKDWVAIIKKNIECSDEYREAKAVSDAHKASVTYFNHFLDTLQDKADRGERIDPKAFEKEVASYASRLAAPAIADLMYTAFMERNKILQLGERLIQKGRDDIDRRAEQAMERVEGRMRTWLDNKLKEQAIRLAIMERIKEEQNVNLMRAVTLKEEAEKYKYKWTLSPAGQYRNLRNIFKRHALLKEAEQALHSYTPKTVQDIAEEARQMHEETITELEAEVSALKDAFETAKEKISGLNHDDMDILDAQLKRALDNCRDNLTLARLEVARTAMKKDI